jgi:signal recognition particle receptor subunit beta
MESPLEIICLSSDVPISRYNNFLYDIPYVIFVFDSTRLSIDYLERVRLMLKHIFQCNSSSEKLLILLNKTDVITVVNANVLEKYLRLNTLDMEYLIIPSSAKSGYGISEGMNWLLR